MSDEWVVLELNPKSEGEDPESLRQGILQALKSPGEVFIPACVTQVGGDRTIHYLIEGYAFVRRTLDDQPYLRLEGSRFVQSVLTRGGSRHSRALATVTNDHIERLRAQIDAEVNQGIGVGDQVVITSGHYKHITATVIEEIPEQDAVQVYIQLRSKQTIVTLPRSFLQISTRSPLAPLLGRLNHLRSWVTLAGPVFDWEDKFDPLWQDYLHLSRLEGWLARGAPTYSFLRFFDHELLVKANLPSKIAEIERLNGWLEAGRVMAVHARVEAGPQFDAKVLELAWFEDVLDRGRKIRAETQDLLLRMATRRRTGAGKLPQNVVVDGHNLAFRCLFAPGMADLSDSQGRGTGAILGFLRSLGALRKKFPTSALYVAWDGSSQRRKAKYPEYKANRHHSGGNGVSSGWDQIGYLRGVLPALGVYQVFNPNEEADDVIATLVRKRIPSQKTVIFSTDRDFLQLVTDTVSVLIPATGQRNELLFDPSAVEEHYGVKPKDMVQLRALTGDTSDNLPGVPRVPKKVLRDLIQAHGTVEGLYRSGFVGLSKIQYERIRQAEAQVRINLDLMALRDVPLTKVDPTPNPDAVASFLKEVEINPNSILETFFERSSEIATGLTL